MLETFFHVVNHGGTDCEFWKWVRILFNKGLCYWHVLLPAS